jgi:sterol desaturase/sphingolipid hydroxylase (fatty acid hydroxylase superfamily)
VSDPLGLRIILVTFLVFVPIERLFAARPQKFFRSGLRIDLIFLFFNGWLVKIGLIGFITAGVLASTWVVPASLKDTVHDLSFWVQLPLVVLLADLGVYWTHRALHASPTLWRIHAVHHAVEEVDWLAAVHQHPLDVIFMKGGSLFPILALGFSEAAIGAYIFLYYWQSYLIHANIRGNYGPLRYVLVSPEFHHWHHSREHEARDKNFAGCFAFIDALFGSLHLPKGRKPETFGVDHPMPKGYLSLVAYPFVAWLSTRSNAEKTEQVTDCTIGASFEMGTSAKSKPPLR